MLTGTTLSTASVAAMAVLGSGGDVAPGGHTDIVLAGSPGTIVPLFADVGMTHQAIAGVDGPLLLSLTSALFVNALVVPGTGSLTIPFDIPNETWLRGTWVFLQGVGIEGGRPPYLTDVGELRVR